LAIGTQTIDLEEPQGAPRILHRVDRCCFGATSSYTQIWDVRVIGSTVRFKAPGRDMDTFTCLTASGKLQSVSVDGVMTPHGQGCGRPDSAIFAADLNRVREFALTYA